MSTPKANFMEMRLHRARNMLVQTEQSVTEIAMVTGFRPASYFSRAYRGHFGKSPLAQRSTLGWAAKGEARH
jgi:transcriptional regulator GlxA family with amidase domain